MVPKKFENKKRERKKNRDKKKNEIKMIQSCQLFLYVFWNLGGVCFFTNSKYNLNAS